MYVYYHGARSYRSDHMCDGAVLSTGDSLQKIALSVAIGQELGGIQDWSDVPV